MHSIVRFSQVLILSVCMLLFALILMLAGCSADQGVSDIAQNPIVPDIYTADPAALIYDDTFYIFCGHEISPNDNWPFIVPQWRILSSTDMKNWTDHGPILKSTDVSWINNNECWASHCVERDGTFYWYICDSSEIGVVTSDDILGPYTDPVGSPIVPSKYAGIDPHCFIDDDGQAYLYWSKNGGCYQSKLSDDMLSITGEVKHYKLPGWVEAPWVFNKNGTYYMMYSASDGYKLGPIKYATSDDPMGPWTVIGDCLGQVSSFANHEAAIEYKGQWYMVYHNAEAPDGSCYKRSVCVDKMYWNEDGTIRKVIQTPVTKNILPVSDKTGLTWKYTTTEPDTNWFEPSYDDSKWKEGQAPFGDIDICRTKDKWQEGTIWLRKTFNPGDLTKEELATTRLRIWYDNDDPTVYINGVLAFTEKAYTTCYVTRDMTREARDSIAANKENTIAVKCTKKDGVVLIDAGLYNKLGDATPATPLVLAPVAEPAKPLYKAKQ